MESSSKLQSKSEAGHITRDDPPLICWGALSERATGHENRVDAVSTIECQSTTPAGKYRR